MTPSQKRCSWVMASGDRREFDEPCCRRRCFEACRSLQASTPERNAFLKSSPGYLRFHHVPDTCIVCSCGFCRRACVQVAESAGLQASEAAGQGACSSDQPAVTWWRWRLLQKLALFQKRPFWLCKAEGMNEIVLAVLVDYADGVGNPAKGNSKNQPSLSATKLRHK